jgi:integrase
MPKKQPFKYLKVELHRGALRFRLRRVEGGKETKLTLPGHPATDPQAHAMWVAFMHGETAPKVERATRFATGTFGEACTRYLASPTFMALAPITQSQYRRQIDALRRDFGAIRLGVFERKDIVRIIERKAGRPGAANNDLRVLKVVFGYCVNAGLLDRSPAAGIGAFKVTTERGGGAETWLDEHAAMFCARWPLGSPERTAFAIMWDTGLRIGDACSFGPQHIRDGRVRMVTHKKKVLVDLPFSEMPELAKALAAVPVRHLTFLATQGGRTRSAKGASDWFSAAAREAGLPRGYTAHGCRKGFLTAAAEGGGTELQLAAMAGHGSTKSVAPYVKAARRAKLADAGYAARREGKTGTGIGPHENSGAKKQA